MIVLLNNCILQSLNLRVNLRQRARLSQVSYRLQLHSSVITVISESEPAGEPEPGSEPEPEGESEPEPAAEPEVEGATSWTPRGDFHAMGNYTETVWAVELFKMVCRLH